MSNSLSDGIYILHKDSPSIFVGGSPKIFSGLHSSWEDDIALLKPWSKKKSAWQGDSDYKGAAFVVAQCKSTMDVAWHFLKSGFFSDWDCVIAGTQTQGRGQLRRSWISDPGNLFVSMLVPAYSEVWKNLVSLVAGYCFCISLRSLGVDAYIKWPNDLLVHDCKVGGILVEERQGFCVVGFGLNIVTSPDNKCLRHEKVVPSQCLASFMDILGPLSIWMKLRPIFLREWKNLFCQDSSASFLDDVSTHLAWKGKKVLVTDHKSECKVRIEGLCSDGGLRVSRNGCEQTLYSGSILLI